MGCMFADCDPNRNSFRESPRLTAYFITGQRCYDPNSFCLSCSLNRTIPDLSVANNRELWIKLEGSKQRLLYTLLRLGLTVIPRSLDPVNGLAFDFLSDNDPDFPEGCLPISSS